MVSWRWCCDDNGDEDGGGHCGDGTGDDRTGFSGGDESDNPGRRATIPSMLMFIVFKRD